MTNTLEVLQHRAQSQTGSQPPTENRPPLVFIHGAYCGAWVWAEYFLPWFAARGWDCYAPSLRGHGDSPTQGPIDLCRLEHYVVDALSVIDSLPTAPVVIGHSMGGAVAQRCLARRRLPGAALIASAPPHGLLESSIGLAWRDPFVFSQMSLLASFGRDFVVPEGVRRAMFSPRVGMDQLAKWEPLLCDESRRVLMEMNVWNPFPPRPLGKPPILVLGGERDVLFPPDQSKITARFYGVQAELFPEMGHTVMLEPDWEIAAERLESWLLADVAAAA